MFEHNRQRGLLPSKYIRVALHLKLRERKGTLPNEELTICKPDKP